MKIFKTFISLLFLVLLTHSVHSQIIVSLIFGESLNRPNMQFGLEVGANSSTVSNYDIADFAAGFEIGMFLNWKYADRWALYSGLMANSNRGFRGEEVLVDPIYRPGTETGYAFKYMKTRLVYVGAHSAMRYYFSPSFSIAGGLNLSLRLKATNEALYSKDKADLNVVYSVKEEFFPIDAGPTLTFLYQFRKGKGMSIIARGYYGLIDVAEEVPGYQSSYFFQLTAGILIGAKKGREMAEKLNPE